MKKTNQEFIIKALQDLLQKTVAQYEWCLEANKKVMRTETDNWYLKWKVGYLEQRIKEHLPNADLYHKDDALFEELINAENEVKKKEQK